MARFWTNLEESALCLQSSSDPGATCLRFMSSGAPRSRARPSRTCLIAVNAQPTKRMSPALPLMCPKNGPGVSVKFWPYQPGFPSPNHGSKNYRATEVSARAAPRIPCGLATLNGGNTLTTTSRTHSNQRQTATAARSHRPPQCRPRRHGFGNGRFSGFIQ